MQTKTHFFNQVARGDAPFVLSAEETDKLAAFRNRLGTLSGLRILEPGCGTGVLTAHLAAWVGSSGEVIAFDPSPEMVKTCQVALTKCPQVKVRQAAAENFEACATGYDLIFCCRVYPHLDKKDVALRRFYQWLRPEGRLVILNFTGSRKLNAWHAGLDHAVHHDIMPSGPDLACHLRNAGFEITEVTDNDNEFFAIAQRPVPQ